MIKIQTGKNLALQFPEGTFWKEKNNLSKNQASQSYSTSTGRVADFRGHAFAYLFLKQAVQFTYICMFHSKKLTVSM